MKSNGRQEMTHVRSWRQVVVHVGVARLRDEKLRKRGPFRVQRRRGGVDLIP
ncbi:hypothetical protein DsansV1_C08g0080391 [Dioscorea sansibarensis]